MRKYILFIWINPLIIISLISFACLPNSAFSIEPIGTIGQPIPKKHAFLDHETILRVVPTHIQVVDTNTGDVIDEFGDIKYGNRVVFSPTASHLAIITYDKALEKSTVSIWDTKARQLVAAWEIASSVYDRMVFSPNEPIVAILFRKEINVINWQTGQSIGKLMRENFPSYQAMAFSLDSRYLYIASAYYVEAWNLETYLFEGNFEGPFIDRIDGMTLSPNGKAIATYKYNSNKIHLWDVSSREFIWQNSSGSTDVSEIVFSPDSQRLYTISPKGDPQVWIWDIKSEERVDSFTTKYNDLTTFILSLDEKTALLHYWDVEVLWDIENKSPRTVWSDYTDLEVVLSANGKTLAVLTANYIKTWDISSQRLRSYFTTKNDFTRDFAISPDGDKFARNPDNRIELWNLQTGEIEIQFPHFIGFAETITYSSSGRWIAVVNDFRKLFILDVNNPEKIQQFKTEDFNITSGFSDVVFSNNDKYLAATGRTRNQQYSIQLWEQVGDTFIPGYSWLDPDRNTRLDLDFVSEVDGRTVLAVTGPEGGTLWSLLPDNPKLHTTFDEWYPVFFRSEGRYLLTTHNDNLQVWDWQTKTLHTEITIPDYHDLSQDGTVLLSFNNDRQIQIWDGTELLPSEPEPTSVEPNGKKIVTLGHIKRNQLLQNFPNPFNPETWIPFRLADESRVTINIYTPTGTLIRTLSTGTIEAGDYSSYSKAVHWDGRNDKGEQVSSSIYLYTINAGDFSATRKMIIKK